MEFSVNLCIQKVDLSTSTRGRKVQLSRYTALFSYQTALQREGPLQGSCVQVSSGWVLHTPGAPPTPPGHTGRSCRSSRATPALIAGPKALRPLPCPPVFLHCPPAPSALLPARPAAPSPISLTSKQPLPLLTRTLRSRRVRPLTIHASHWAAPSPEAANQSW